MLNLKEYRTRNKLTAIQLACCLGVYRSTVYYAEKSGIVPDLWLYVLFTIEKHRDKFLTTKAMVKHFQKARLKIRGD